jgi:hypothetical protein
MEALRRWFAIVLADFRERSRNTRFWVVLGAVAIGTWWCFPPADAGYVTVALGDLRGAYSPAWIGMVLALMYASMLTLAGFYIVRGTLVRDFETRVWQLLSATPLTRGGWLLAKWTSHMAVFALLVAVGLGVGVVVQLWRGESTAIAPWQLVLPALVITMPALAVAATLAVLFDLVPWLRRSGGNVLYFFVWIFVFIAAVSWFDPQEAGRESGIWMSEPGGLSMAMRDLRHVLAQTDPAQAKAGFSIGVNVGADTGRLFAWDHWTPRAIDLLGRAIWVVVALAGLLAMTPMVDWAAARSGAARESGGERTGLRLRWLEPLLRPFDAFRGGRLFAAEWRLVLRQRRAIWWVALAVLWVAQATAPAKGLAIATIGAWLACIDVFARAALRERDTATGALVFTAAGAARRLLVVRIAVSCALALGVVAPALVRAAIADPAAALALVAVAATVALGGLGLAAACRSPRPYELALVFLAYIGVQGDPTLAPFDDPATTLARHAWLLPAGVLLLVAGWSAAVRRR